MFKPKPTGSRERMHSHAHNRAQNGLIIFHFILQTQLTAQMLSFEGIVTKVGMCVLGFQDAIQNV